MTVDRVVEIVESEKCSLDMSSYEDLNSQSRNVGNVNGDAKDDYVFVNGSDSDVVLLDDRVVNRENGEVSEAKLSVEGGDDVVLLDDHVENRENGEVSEVKFSVEVDDDVIKANGGHIENHENKEVSEARLSVEGDVVLSDDHVKNHESTEVSEVKLSVEGDVKVKVNGDVVLSDDLVENHENKAKLSVEGGDNVKALDDRVESHENKEVNVEDGGDVKVNGDVVLSADLVVNEENHENKDSMVNDDVVWPDDHVENHENEEVNAKLSVDGNDDVKATDDVVLSDDHVGNHEIEEVSVEEDDSVKVNGDAGNDKLEKEVKVDGDVSEVENGISFGVEVENGEINSENEVIRAENGILEVGELEPGVSEVKGSITPEHVVDEVKDINDPNPVVDEVKDDSILERVLDEVKESNDQKPVVDEIKEAESVFETGANGNASVDTVDSRSLDGDDSSKISVSNDQDSAEVVAEDNTAVNGVSDALDDSDVNEGSVSEPVVDELREVNDPESVVDDVKEVDTTIGVIGSRSLDVDDNNTRTDFVTQESDEVESEDSTAVNGVPDAPESAEVEAQIIPSTVEIPEGGLEEEQIVPPVENEIEIQVGVPLKVEDVLKMTEGNGDVHPEFESSDRLVMESEHLKADVNDESVENDLADAQSFDSDIRASVQLDAGNKGLALCDVNVTPVEESSDGQQQNVLSIDGESEKHDLIEEEAKIDKQSDAVDPVADGESREALGGELDQCEKGENTDQIGLDSLPIQSEGVQNQGNLEVAAREMDIPVSITAGQSDERKIESTAEVEETIGASTALQFDTTDKPALEDEQEIVDGDVESEVITKTEGVQEASPEEGVLQDQVTEKTRSIDAVDEEISKVDCSLDQIDQGGTYARDNAAENKDVPASEHSSEEAGNGLRSDSLNSDPELPAPFESNNVKEQGVGSDISAADNSPSDSESKSETVHSETDVTIKTNSIFDGTSRPEINFGSFGSGPPLSYNDINSRSDVLNKPTAVGTANDEAVLTSPANGDHSDGLNHDTSCSQVAKPEQVNEVSASSVEGSEADSSDARNVNPDLVRRPFYWLIKVPRFDEEKYKDQLRQSEIELMETTKARDASQAEFNKQQAYCRELRSDLEAANLEVKARRELVWVKSRELDSAHSSLNLARHGITAEDLDNKIHNLEHRMQHQTLNNLKEEKELVREIKQLNLQRQKLSADPERLQAIQQARAQREQTEEQLKVLKKELTALKDNLSKADEHLRAVRKKHDDESELLNHFKDQVKSANDIRQEAYIHLITVKKQLNEKNSPFFKAKKDLGDAYKYAMAGNKDSLEHHCVNQVEKIMKMWNKNDEFRKEYIQSNMKRMAWKFGTSDGTCLGMDELRPSLGDVSDKKVNAPAKANHPGTGILTRERDLPEEPKPTEDKLLKKAEQKTAPPVKKIEAISKKNLAKASGIIEIEEDTEIPELTKEEEELAEKAEQLKREEEAARLMEQRRLEEKVKAEEALERKRKNAIKAQARAEFKARKEAEEKEKEKEKRAKKKGKKRGINVEITENEPVQPSEPSSESVKEPEVTEKLATKAKRPQKTSLHSKQLKNTKSIPPALRNKGKRGFLRYWPYALIVLLAIALFYLGSYERIQTIRQHIFALLHW